MTKADDMLGTKGLRFHLIGGQCVRNNKDPLFYSGFFGRENEMKKGATDAV